MSQWEYAVRELKIDDRPADIERMLNGMSADDWELLRLDSGFFLFRRPCRRYADWMPDVELR